MKEDGYHQAAGAVSDATMTPFVSGEHRGRLAHLIALGIAIEKERGIQYVPTSGAEKIDVAAVLKEIRGIDFETDTGMMKQYPNYQTRFITTHKNSCRCAKFSPDGKYIATGSADTSIKLLDVEKMMSYSQLKNEAEKIEGEDMQLSRPVIRTFYDHTAAINDLDFHPTFSVLASCGRDCSVKFYDYNSSVKRSFKQLQDTHNIRTICFHPCGDYLLAGTEHTMIRLYDIKSEKPYINPIDKHNHFGPINMVRYAADGRIFASCSKDGSVKLWDGVDNSCVNTIPNAHAGREVTTVQFSRNKKYLLTAGKDAMIRIWDVGSGREIKRIYTGNQKHPYWDNRLQVCFSYTEDYIFSSDENNNSGVIWDTRTGELVQRLSGHNGVVRWIASSPTDPHAMTCSDDHRARFWVEETPSSD
uniref:Cleavage stimulation factor 50 kDa subunit n=1 Tax=Arcella intermedia TaxID=1963864 RepID=A0A6B2L520_9EUKA